MKAPEIRGVEFFVLSSFWNFLGYRPNVAKYEKKVLPRSAVSAKELELAVVSIVPRVELRRSEQVRSGRC